ncbi:MAG: 2Fe-2S iron-sulfur cluster binding domain-containing protein [Pseudolabrys sp.]|nr:2Fe-2S iron-sulfur cluster binding domain-containing protein [Pseudolabrys sp.]
MITVSIIVNNELVSAEVEPRTHLADFLREHVRVTGTHLGCEHGVCGSCTVLVNGVPIRSCITLAVACEGLEVRSIEGFDVDSVMESLRAAFSREHALQCGFCTPGMLIAARDIILRLPDADEARIRRELAGNLCRCTGYLGIIKAVHSVVREQAKLKGMVAAGPAPVKRAAAPATVFPPNLDQARQDPIPAAPAGLVRANEAGEPATPSQSKQGWTRFEEKFVIHRPTTEVWEALANFPVIASCLPGAELIEHDQQHVKGRMTVRLGPINAAFSGSAVITRDETTMSGSVRGAGTDDGSKSRTKAVATYRAVANPSGPGTCISLEVEYNLQGPLAQFSRSELAQELGRRLIGEFASNLNGRLQDPHMGALGKPAALNANALIWATLTQRVKRFFSRMAGGREGSH